MNRRETQTELPGMGQKEVAALPATTAIYPNRMRDRRNLETRTGLQEKGNKETRFLTNKGTLFATGYNRIVYGDHGPYIEFLPEHIQCPLRKKYKRPDKPEWYYIWMEPLDGSQTKVYDQRRDVKHIPNPPAGGFRGNRREGYADYVPGRIYVSPEELTIQP
jgi:hypothetical protein